MMEIKTVAMVNEEGRRNVKIANGLRTQAYEKIMEILCDAGFDATKAANGDIAFPLVQDESTGDIYYIRLAVSLSNKALESKVVKKAKAKTDDVEIPTLFGDEE